MKSLDARKCPSLRIAMALAHTLAACALLGSPVMAQEPRHAIVAIKPDPNESVRIEARKPLTLLVRRSSLDKGPGVVVRLFRGTRDSLIRAPHRLANGCWEYDGSIPREVGLDDVQPQAFAQVRIGETSRAWLDSDNRGEYAPQPWVVVLETRGSSASAPGTTIRLVPGDVRKYFMTGIEVLVTPDVQGVSPDEVKRVLNENERDWWAQVARLVLEPSGCMSVRFATDESVAAELLADTCSGEAPDVGYDDDLVDDANLATWTRGQSERGAVATAKERK